MPKTAFMASFLAFFLMMDGHFFHGETTRIIWEGASEAAHLAHVQAMRFLPRR